MKQYILLFCFMLFSLLTTAQFSGLGPVTLTTPSGASNIQWYEYTTGGASAISGETNLTYSTSVPGLYYAQYTDNSQPASCQNQQTVFTYIMLDGENVTLNGSTNNSGNTNYQWYSDSSIIAGATSADYTTTIGGFYQLTYDKGGCTVISKPYLVFVLQTDTDGDGKPDSCDPNPNAATALDDGGIAPTGSATSFDILANDDFLPNNNSINAGTTTLSNTGNGNAGGTIALDAADGTLNYTPLIGEIGNTVTIEYQVCNNATGAAVCATATVSLSVVDPNADTDGDGVFDLNDNCPNTTTAQANSAGFISDCGVSPNTCGCTDNDGDGYFPDAIGATNDPNDTDICIPNSSNCIENICPANTVDLSTAFSVSNQPVGTSLTWHTTTPPTTANKIADVTALGVGTYYAAFYDATNDCYSDTTTAITVTITTCTDTDGDGISDSEDLDDDNDGIPDVTETATASNGGDTDGDGIPDHLDLDSDNDGINDVIEAGGADNDDNGMADGPVGTTGSSKGIPSTAGTGLVPPNTDGVGAPDYQDLDADDDGISDLVESGQDPSVVDLDDNGVVDTGTDADNDGIQDLVDGTLTFGDSGSSTPQDDDNDNIPNFQDLDSNDPNNVIGDGNDDVDDNGNSLLDANNDGKIDPTADADNDGIDDSIDEDLGVFGGLGNDQDLDTDNDGIPNLADLDDDNDGILDTDEGYCTTNAVYELDVTATMAGATIAPNGGNFNLVYTLSSGVAVPSLGNTFTIPFTYSDYNSYNGVNHEWEGFNIVAATGYIGDRLSIRSNVASLYGGLPTSNTISEAVTGNTGAEKWNNLLNSGAINQLGTFSITIGNPPSPTGAVLEMDSIYITSRSNVAGAPNIWHSGFYAKPQSQSGLGTKSPLALHHTGTYIYDYTAFSNGTSFVGNAGARGFIEIYNGTITYCFPTDTDGDGIPDAQDLDSDNDGINDVVEAGGTDANNDGQADGTAGTTPTTNGIPATANTGLTPVNTDGVGAPDFQDLDADDDGISDLVESGQDPAIVDLDDNGVVDDGIDADNDGIQDLVDGTPTFGDSGSTTPKDDDNDNIPNYQDLDSDDPNNVIGDGNDDIDDSGNSPLDANNDGKIDPTVDADNDGIDDGIDEDLGNFGGLGAPDTDGDGIPNSEDLDDDNDGIPDTVENATAFNGGDTDGDGIPDYLDLDADNDGINDVIEAGGTDANNDGQADGTVGTTPTTNGIPATANTGLTPVNTDGVGAPDFQDLDADDDGISDLVESGQDPAIVDLDDNGVVDDGIDADNDGIQDLVDGTPTFGDSGSTTPKDDDNDNIPNYQDLDSDDPNNVIGDGNDDIDDSGNSPLDANNDGKIDPTVDADNDGIDDGIDEDLGNFGGLGAPDTDGDGIPNSEDLDDDNDGIPDTVENATASNGGDTDGDGIPDHLDLDSDNDGINDVIEAGGTDANNDGQADGTVGTTPTTNGIPATANTGLTPVNTDGVGAPDYQDLDADDDGISDLVESGQDPAIVDLDDNGVVDDGIDADNDGIQDLVDGTPTFGDSGSTTPKDDDNDNIPNYQDLDSDDPNNVIGDGNDDIDDSGNGPLDANDDGKIDPTVDADNDGIDDGIDEDLGTFGGLGAPDTDGDGIPNSEDLDDDNDGIPDTVENATASNGGDTDGDGIPDYLDLDADNDGINDVIEAGGTDANNDGQADGTVGTTPTTNGIPATANTGVTPVNTDGVGAPDYQDLDADDDGISDLVESGQDPAIVDLDNNGVVDDGIDADNDGIQDLVDGTPTFGDSGSTTPKDDDNDNIPNYQDLDSDDPNNVIGDGNDDVDDSGNSPLDANDDGKIDPTVDADNDGIDDGIDEDLGNFGGLGAPDTDGDGIPNSEDLDDDNDGIPDAIENATASNNGDTDGDGIRDHLDLDSDNDGINDVIEAGGTDANNDGQADGTVGTTPTTNGIPATAGTGLTPVNTDGVGAPDFQDLDSDEDGVNDLIESGNSSLIDANNDGKVDGTDPDNDGILGTADGSSTYGDANDPTLLNTDGDALPNYQDPDDDGDNINTEDEDTNDNEDRTDDDTDGDGTPDYLDGDTFIRISAKVFLQGAYNGTTGLMKDDIRSQNYLPTAEPYAGFGYNHTGGGGGETTFADKFSVTGSDAIVDWIILELRDQVDPSIIVGSRSALLQRDGDIVDMDGISSVTFLNKAIDNYYLAVKHRNHLGTMIDIPISMSQDITAIDFTSSTQGLYQKAGPGSSNYPQKVYNNGTRALWAGNVDFNDRVVFQGSPVDQDGIFFGVLLDSGNTNMAANYIQDGYHRGDVNMDGRAIFQGSPNDTDIIFFNIVGHPGNTGLLSNFIMIEQIP